VGGYPEEGTRSISRSQPARKTCGSTTPQVRVGDVALDGFWSLTKSTKTSEWLPPKPKTSTNGLSVKQHPRAKRGRDGFRSPSSSAGATARPELPPIYTGVGITRYALFARASGKSLGRPRWSFHWHKTRDVEGPVCPCSSEGNPRHHEAKQRRKIRAVPAIFWRPGYPMSWAKVL